MKITYTARRAGTATYWDMDRQDLARIREQLERVMIEVAERNLSRDAQDRALVQIWTESAPQLGRSPRYQQQNNIAAVVGGILKNFRTGTRDLTDKNCEKIQEIFDVIQSGAEMGLIPDLQIERIRFQEARTLVTTTFSSLFT